MSSHCICPTVSIWPLYSWNCKIRLLNLLLHVSHLEIPILECETFSSINLNFKKDFIWFKLKWFDLILYFNEFEKSKYLNGVQNFLLNFSFIWVVKTFKQKVLSLKSLFKKIFLLSIFIQKGLQKFIKSLHNCIQIPTSIHFPSLCCHQGISVPIKALGIKSYIWFTPYVSRSYLHVKHDRCTHTLKQSIHLSNHPII
jgi:hypothetical protein